MRRYDEPIQVRLGRVADDEGPEQFLWRDRLWRVLVVQNRWIESGPWWRHTDELDLLEEEVWRVEAADARAGSRGVYDLAHRLGGPDWQLRAVFD